MMAHVAEAAESSGRVLVWTDRGAPLNYGAAQAAARLAAAFNAEIETISVSRQDGPDLQDIPFARVAGNAAGALSERPPFKMVFEAENFSARRQRREIAAAARSFGVVCRHTESSGDAIDILSELCLLRGPWNVVVAAGRPCVNAIGTLFANVSGATGIVAAPRHIRFPDGPVVVVAEDMDRFPSMLRAARRLTRMFAPIHVFPAAATRRELGELEAYCRLTATPDSGLTVSASEPGYGADGAFNDGLRRLRAGYIVSRFGGTLLPSAHSLGATIEAAGAPFLLVR